MAKMKRRRTGNPIWIGVGLGLLIASCDPMPSRVRAALDQSLAGVQPTRVAKPNPKPKRVTNRKANLKGRTLILEYHKLSSRNNDLNRTPAGFRRDLETLYKDGFRPVTIAQWLSGDMPLAPGASPVALTFDDSHPSQLRFRKDGTVDPNCFVGIWQDFAKTHPDFPVHGTFFVLPPWPFGQAKHIEDKVRLLQKLGSEVASHTYHHLNLTKCDDETVKREIATSLDFLEKRFGITKVPLAYPYGNRPKNMSLMKGFTWNGKRYAVTAAFVAAGNPAKPPTDPDFDPYRIPRVLAGDGREAGTSWMRVMKTSTRFAPYVAP